MSNKKEEEQKLKDYLDHPDTGNHIYIYPERQDTFGSNFGSTSYAFQGCAPLISVQNAISSERTTTATVGIGTGPTNVGVIKTITMNGYLFATGASAIFTKQKALEDALTSDKFYTIEVTTSQGTLVKTFYACTVQTINHEEGVYVTHSKYSITFESSTSRDNTYFHTDFSYNLSIASNMDYNELNASATDLQTWQGYYVATETITASANFGAGKDRAVNALRFANEKSHFGQTDGENIWVQNAGWRGDSVGSQYQVRNYSSSSSVNATTGEVTKTSTFILVYNSSYKKALGQYSLEYNSSVDDPNTTVTVTGSFLGLIKVGASDTRMLDQAALGFNAFYPQILTKIKATFPSLSDKINSTSYNWTTTRNYSAGTLDFTLVYNTREENIIKVNGLVATSFEKIESNYSGGTTVLNIVPVIGRSLGPVLQDTGTVSERTKDFTLEVVYFKDKGNSGGPGTETIITNNTPSATANKFVYMTADNVTWNPNEYRYVRNITWVYEPHPT